MDQTTETADKKEFNLKVHYRDEKTGLVTQEDSYTLRIIAAGDGGKMRLWERPKNSGNLFDKKNEPIGRWVKGKWEKDAKHVAFEKPLTNDQKLASALAQKDARVLELERELAAIKAEQEKKSKDVKPETSGKPGA